MAVGDVKTSTPRKLGGIPEFGKVELHVAPTRPAGRETPVADVNPTLGTDTYTPQSPQPEAPALSKEQERTMQRIGSTIGAGIGALFSYGFLRKASRLIAGGKPVGIGLGKIVPLIGAGIGAWGLVKKITVEWNLAGNNRKWDDLIRMAADGMSVAGGIAALVPAVGLIPGLTLQLAAIGVNWLGDMFNDAPAPPSNPLAGLFGGDKTDQAKK